MRAELRRLLSVSALLGAAIALPAFGKRGVQRCHTACQSRFTDCYEACEADEDCVRGCQRDVEGCAARCLASASASGSASPARSASASASASAAPSGSAPKRRKDRKAVETTWFDAHVPEAERRGTQLALERNVIRLTRLNGDVIAINPDIISWAEQNPDTTLVLLGGERLLVRESLDELGERVVDYRRRSRGAADAWPPHGEALAIAERRKDPDAPRRSSLPAADPSRGDG